MKQVDARALANLILSAAWERGFVVSNLKLQKLLFLCHAFLLVEKDRDVVRDEFVAWKYGPVHRDVYDAFKKFGASPIDDFAARVNPATGKTTTFTPIRDQVVQDVVNRVVAFYGNWTPGQLVELTHAQGGPWDIVVKTASTTANVGLRISKEAIQGGYKYLWFGAKRDLKGEEPHEDQPLVA